ncbi:hypothetical protein RRG08_037048 [Elysia crispata]|uniref:Uncharacterized protein n=1 Tax=Elysia crispata TaxID=231223 RepID=A0AAE0YBS4_9GAST|nr:hypothetical protein RRG08_037048 [Elysia crispata]
MIFGAENDIQTKNVMIQKKKKTPGKIKHCSAFLHIEQCFLNNTAISFLLFLFSSSRFKEKNNKPTPDLMVQTAGLLNSRETTFVLFPSSTCTVPER